MKSPIMDLDWPRLFMVKEPTWREGEREGGREGGREGE